MNKSPLRLLNELHNLEMESHEKKAAIELTDEQTGGNPFEASIIDKPFHVIDADKYAVLTVGEYSTRKEAQAHIDKAQKYFSSCMFIKEIK